MKGRLWAVFRKELTDHMRDSRSLSSALIFPIFGPLVFALTMGVVAGWADSGQATTVAVVGAERAPSLMSFLRKYGMETELAPADYEDRVRDGTLDAALVVPEGFADRWTSGRPAEVQLLYDQSQRSVAARVEKLRAILSAYSGLIATERLMARGVSPDLAQPLMIVEVDLATPEKLAGMLLNIVPIFLVLAAFVGGMNVAIDTTAGERERGSLEPLLVNPVPRSALVLGKWLTTALVASMTITLTLIGFYVALKRVPLETLGVKALIGPSEALRILLGVLPLTALASSVQMLVATYARSFKEAQTYLSLMTFIPMVPGMLLAFAPIEAKFGMTLVPVLGQHLLIDGVITGESWGVLEWALSIVGIAVPTAVCLWGCTRLLVRERIVFGR